MELRLASKVDVSNGQWDFLFNRTFTPMDNLEPRIFGEFGRKPTRAWSKHTNSTREGLSLYVAVLLTIIQFPYLGWYSVATLHASTKA